jgi:glutamate/tyrosine decarboxylase-like PLP-dependent enzyme
MLKEPSADLDLDLGGFREALGTASDLVIRLYRGLDETRVTPASSRAEIAALFDQPMPEQPQAIEEILREVEQHIFANSTLSLSPRFLGYINSGGNQASILAELLASAVNQICALWHFSPSASEVEGRVVRWIAEFIGYPADASGCLLSGGSAANLVGLAVARKEKAQFDVAALGTGVGPPLTVYVSEEAHASIEKAMVLLGMGRHQLRRVAARDDFTIDLKALEQRVSEDRQNGDRPICVVGTAGTTNTGAIDPMDALADFCQEHDLWFHVDAGYGGPAAGTNAAGALFRGLERADSVAINPHKWLFVPAEAGCILVRGRGRLKETFNVSAEYLPEAEGMSADGPIDFKDYGPQLHRSFRALKVWMTFKGYGARRLRSAIENNIDVMRYLADQIDQSPDFVRLAPVPLSIVCFQYRTSNPVLQHKQQFLDDLNHRLLDALEKDGRIFLSGTTIHGRRALRACSVNHRLRREHVDLALQVIREVGSALADSLR